GMLAQAEDRRAVVRLVRAHAFEHRQAVVQGVSQDVGGRIPPRNEFSVVPDETVTVGHGHLRVLQRVRRWYRLNNADSSANVTIVAGGADMTIASLRPASNSVSREALQRFSSARRTSRRDS